MLAKSQAHSLSDGTIDSEMDDLGRGFVIYDVGIRAIDHEEGMLAFCVP